MNKYTIGVLSDTHLDARSIDENSGMFFRLKKIADKFFKKVDLILHAGDIESIRVIEFLNDYAPTIFVPGNGDIEEPIKKEPEIRIIDKNSISFLPDGLKIAMAHERKKLFSYGSDPSINLFIFGHSHMPSIELYEHQYWINPGSVKRPCGDIKKTSIAIIEISEKIEVIIEYFTD